MPCKEWHFHGRFLSSICFLGSASPPLRPLGWREGLPALARPSEGRHGPLEFISSLCVWQCHGWEFVKNFVVWFLPAFLIFSPLFAFRPVRTFATSRWHLTVFTSTGSPGRSVTLPKAHTSVCPQSILGRFSKTTVWGQGLLDHSAALGVAYTSPHTSLSTYLDEIFSDKTKSVSSSSLAEERTGGKWSFRYWVWL